MRGINYNSANWSNFKSRAKRVKSIQDQQQINRELIGYISMLQDQITEIKKSLEDDGR